MFAAGRRKFVPLSEERVQVEKKPMLKEEVLVGEREVKETKRVSRTPRRTAGRA